MNVRTQSGRTTLLVVGGVAAVCLVLQGMSATARQQGFETPNTATWIARTLAQSGEFSSGDRRAYHLPVEPLYLAAGFTMLPPGAWRYLHVPVTVLLVAAIAFVGLAIGGPSAGVAAGLIAALDPFVLALAILLLPRLKSLRPAGGAMLAGLTIALAVWGVRNVQVLGAFQIGSTRDGKALFESNCAYTLQGIRELGGVGHFTLDCSPAQVTHAFSLNEVESDRALRRYAVDYITSHPWDVAGTAAFKTVVSLSGYDFRSSALSARNLVACAAALLLTVFGVHGLLRAWPTLPDSRLRDLVLLIAATVVTVTLAMLAIGPTGLRYRISLAGLLHIGIAAALVTRAAPVTHGFSFSRLVATSGR